VTKVRLAPPTAPKAPVGRVASVTPKAPAVPKVPVAPVARVASVAQVAKTAQVAVPAAPVALKAPVGASDLTADLLSKGLIKDPKNFSYKLNSDELVIDGETQPEVIQKRYRKYLKHWGQTINCTVKTD